MDGFIAGWLSILNGWLAQAAGVIGFPISGIWVQRLAHITIVFDFIVYEPYDILIAQLLNVQNLCGINISVYVCSRCV